MERFSISVRTGPGSHPASYTKGNVSFSGVKRPGRGVDHPPPSSAEVKQRVDLYLYSPYGPWWLVYGEIYLTITLYTKNIMPCTDHQILSGRLNQEKSDRRGLWQLQGRWESLRETYHLEDVAIDRRIILEWITKQISWEGVDWSYLAQENDQWPAVVN